MTTAVAKKEEVRAALDGFPSLPPPLRRGVFEEYIQAVAGTTSASPSYHFGSLLVVIGAILGRSVCFKYAYRLYPNFYIALIGASGRTKKSTAINLALKEVLGAVDPDVVLVPGAGSGEGLLEILSRKEATRAVLCPAEAAVLWRKAKQEATNSVIPLLTDLYDCHDRVCLPNRKVVEANHPFLSLLSPTAPDWLQHLATEDLSAGFGNRHLFIPANAGEPIPLPDAAEFGSVVKQLKTLKETCLDRQRVFRLSREAEEYWHDYFVPAEKIVGETELITVLTERLTSHVLKVALVFAALENTELITREQLEAATALDPWQRQCVENLFLGFGESKVTALARRIKAHLSRVAMSGWQLRQKLGGRVDLETYNRALRGLMQNREVRELSVRNPDTNRERKVLEVCDEC